MFITSENALDDYAQVLLRLCAGQKSKMYTCMLSSRYRVWNRGQVLVNWSEVTPSLLIQFLLGLCFRKFTVILVDF